MSHEKFMQRALLDHRPRAHCAPNMGGPFGAGDRGVTARSSRRAGTRSPRPTIPTAHAEVGRDPPRLRQVRKPSPCRTATSTRACEAVPECCLGRDLLGGASAPSTFAQYEIRSGRDRLRRRVSSTRKCRSRRRYAASPECILRHPGVRISRSRNGRRSRTRFRY